MPGRFRDFALDSSPFGFQSERAMRAAVYHRVAAAACGVGTADLGRLGRIVLDVLTSEGVDLRGGCSLPELKELLRVAVRATRGEPFCMTAAIESDARPVQQTTRGFDELGALCTARRQPLDSERGLP